MADALYRPVLVAETSLDLGAGDLDPRSKVRVLGNWEQLCRAIDFAQGIVLPPNSRIGARQNATLGRAARALLDLCFQQRNRRLVLLLGPRSLTECLVSNAIEEGLRVGGIDVEEPLGLEGIENGQRFARVVQEQGDQGGI